MNWHEAEQLARTLMAEHGLIAAGWQFAWSRGKKELGCCSIKEQRHRITGEKQQIKLIRLSRYLVTMNSDEEVRDTILHEIAHALAGVENGHNDKWQAMCRKVGAKPKRLAGKEVNVVAAPFAVICCDCEKVLAERRKSGA